jgi:hypothetical protein
MPTLRIEHFFSYRLPPDGAYNAFIYLAVSVSPVMVNGFGL